RARRRGIGPGSRGHAGIARPRARDESAGCEAADRRLWSRPAGPFCYGWQPFSPEPKNRLFLGLGLDFDPRHPRERRRHHGNFVAVSAIVEAVAAIRDMA